MTEADQAMYAEKQSHRASRTFEEMVGPKGCCPLGRGAEDRVGR